MKNIYCEFGDGTIVTYNDIGRDNNGEHIRLYFEKTQEDGFSFLETVLPDLVVVDSCGFDKKKVAELLEFAKNNASIIWEDARQISLERVS